MNCAHLLEMGINLNNGIHMEKDDYGRMTGVAFVKINDGNDYEKAVNFQEFTGDKR